MLGWLASAETAGLDEDGIVALFTSVLRDFFKSHQGARGHGGTGRARAGDSETEGVA